MSLHVEVTGRGKPLVMLHGWGMHGGVWHETADKLAEEFEVHAVDLPGHGFSNGKGEGGWGMGGELLSSVAPLASPLSVSKEMQGDPVFPFPLPPSSFPLDSIVSELSAQFPEPLDVLGWSLGGIIAQRWAAREPRQVRRLVLAASTPCFAARADWDCGMPQETLAQFAAELEKNHAATLRRFLSLQLRGSENERELLALLRERLFSRGEPDMKALRGGLDILRDADLRADLPQIQQPMLAIAGERDKLTPPQASHYMAKAMPDARAVVIEGAAHTPFLSHPEIFVEHVKIFLRAE